MTPIDIALIAAAAAASVPAGLRWLRVAQREHYLPRSVMRFAWRWWFVWFPPNRIVAVAALTGAALAERSALAGLGAAAATAFGPFKLGVKGRTSKLAWTLRMKTLAATWAVLHTVVMAFAVSRSGSGAGAIAVAVMTPFLVDVATLLTQSIEQRRAAPFVARAKDKLAMVKPLVVGITGSYGKTTTKGYVAHLLAGTHTVLPTPKSFNNSAGLAKSVNDHLTPGIDVFVAEMGTYGPGEIAAMVEWAEPTIAVITAIGPVHLERFKGEDKIVAAKFEIFAKAATCVINVDSEWLRPLAERMRAAGRSVARVSAGDHEADVVVRRDAGGSATVEVRGAVIARLDRLDAPPTNVGCAVAVADVVGVPHEEIAARLPTLPVADNRLAVRTGDSGATIIDDTYNANPAGARTAIEALLRAASPDGKRVVVTPGMVELGHLQRIENQSFAREAAAAATHLVVVGWTNRPVLLRGAAGGRAEVITVETRDDAVAWVRANLGPGDAVLYENDLPDHFA